MRRLWLESILVLVLLSLGNAAAATPLTLPAGLGLGDQYRLAFITSTRSSPYPRSISFYNDLVTSVADAVPELAALNTTWRVIGTTAFVDARDNTNTSPDTATGVAIYLLDGSRLANDNADLWDGSIDNPLNINEFGLFQGPNAGVWTGTGNPNGTGGFETLEADLVFTGNGDSVDSTWISTELVDSAGFNHLYAMSGVLTAIPEPGSGVLLTLGIIAMSCTGGTRVKAKRADE